MKRGQSMATEDDAKLSGEVVSLPAARLEATLARLAKLHSRVERLEREMGYVRARDRAEERRRLKGALRCWDGGLK
jgi:hypothetical protein